MFRNNEIYCDMLRSLLKPASQRKTQWFVVLWRVSSAWHRPASCGRHTITDSEFKTGGVTPSAVFTRYGPQRLLPFLAATRCPTCTSIQVRRGSRVGGALLTGTANEMLLHPSNFLRSGTQEEVCRTWWGCHWRLMPFTTLSVLFNKSPYIMFLIFI
jgi:hypothetical protein